MIASINVEKNGVTALEWLALDSTRYKVDNVWYICWDVDLNYKSRDSNKRATSRNSVIRIL